MESFVAAEISKSVDKVDFFQTEDWVNVAKHELRLYLWLISFIHKPERRRFITKFGYTL